MNKQEWRKAWRAARTAWKVGDDRTDTPAKEIAAARHDNGPLAMVDVLLFDQRDREYRRYVEQARRDGSLTGTPARQTLCLPYRPWWTTL